MVIVVRFNFHFFQATDPDNDPLTYILASGERDFFELATSDR